MRSKEELIEIAKEVMRFAYAPYSNFRVGAALYCDDGVDCSIFTGANIENSSLGLTICAERVAIFSGVLRGWREREKMLVIVADKKEPLPPCGACRQVMAEFFRPDFEIVSATLTGKIKRWALRELLPHPSRSLEKNERA